MFGNRIISDRILAGLKVECDHFRSVEYFIETIGQDINFTAFQCDDFIDFKKGMCLSSDRLQNMGLGWHEQNTFKGRRDYTMTRKKAPFYG